MKKCMICGWDESDDSKFTCPACGEASWGSVKLEEKAEQSEPAPQKRGPGRPRKSQ